MLKVSLLIENELIKNVIYFWTIDGVNTNM
jgi:hypothetical protein